MLLKIGIGLIIGFIFGFTLQKTGITKYHRVIGMLRLKDFKILKFMLTAIVFSMIGFHLLGYFGIIELHPKSLDWGKPIGGLIFGTGMALLGYCPGTLFVRIGEAKNDAWIALAGMVLGILFFAMNIKFFKTHVIAKTLDGNIFRLIHINSWFVIALAAVLFALIIFFVNKIGKNKQL